MGRAAVHRQVPLRCRHFFGKAARPEGLLRRSDGTTVLEFAILLPAFLLLLLGIVEFGRLFWMQSSLQQAVEAAARCAVISECGTSSSAVQNYAASQMFGLTVPSNTFTVTTGTSCGSGVAGDEVSASMPFNFIVSGLFPWQITLSAQSCRPT